MADSTKSAFCPGVGWTQAEAEEMSRALAVITKWAKGDQRLFPDDTPDDERFDIENEVDIFQEGVADLLKRQIRQTEAERKATTSIWNSEGDESESVEELCIKYQRQMQLLLRTAIERHRLEEECKGKSSADRLKILRDTAVPWTDGTFYGFTAGACGEDESFVKNVAVYTALDGLLTRSSLPDAETEQLLWKGKDAAKRTSGFPANKDCGEYGRLACYWSNGFEDQRGRGGPRAGVAGACLICSGQ